jgi:hypothetical protein
MPGFTPKTPNISIFKRIIVPDCFGKNFPPGNIRILCFNETNFGKDIVPHCFIKKYGTKDHR